jgi:CheY-like chemotaxis protein
VAAHILRGEDNPTNLAVSRYLLQAFGDTALVATDSLASVAVTERKSPDMMLVDLQMPIMKGDEQSVSDVDGFMASESRAH